MKKIVIDKEILYQLYIVERKSLTEISEILKLSRRTVTINIDISCYIKFNGVMCSF